MARVLVFGGGVAAMTRLAAALPFMGILLSFAVIPSLRPRLWHRRIVPISLFWVGLSLVLGGLADGAGAALRDLWGEIVAGYLPLMALLLALYALGGGIAIIGGPWGRPAGNLLLLLIATALASVMGTIGASLLFIHPLLAANAHRREARHLVLAFIILAGNVGGALSPLGDPPLLVGFLAGVPFGWPLRHLGLPLLVVALPVLAATYLIDRRLAAAEVAKTRRRLRLRGWLNVGLLAVLMGFTALAGFWHPGAVRLLGATLPAEQLAMVLAAAACTALSEAFTPRSIRIRNRFAWGAMREITILFFAIFATIAPVFHLLQQVALPPVPGLWFWASGIASAVLDAAPTYLIFFQAAGGDAAHVPARLLTALAAGSVFFGPVTYLGNAPNLMIREIASRHRIRMPGFLSYAVAMSLVLGPLFVVLTLMFF